MFTQSYEVHNTPLIINSLGGKHTHTHVHIPALEAKPHWLAAYVPGLKITEIMLALTLQREWIKNNNRTSSFSVGLIVLYYGSLCKGIHMKPVFWWLRLLGTRLLSQSSGSCKDKVYYRNSYKGMHRRASFLAFVL